MNLKFTTKLTDIKNYTFFNFEEIDKDYDMFEDITIVVEWEAWINVRDYGIKDITPVVKAEDSENKDTISQAMNMREFLSKNDDF